MQLYAQNVVQSVLHPFVLLAEGMSCPVCIFTCEHGQCSSSAVSPGEGQGASLAGVCSSSFPEAEGGALPEESAHHHRHLHRTARGWHHVCGGLLQNQVNTSRPPSPELTGSPGGKGYAEARLHGLVLEGAGDFLLIFGPK